jgi:hypothetical protein
MDVSFSEDKFVVMIENLSWDPVKVAKDIAEEARTSLSRRTT